MSAADPSCPIQLPPPAGPRKFGKLEHPDLIPYLCIGILFGCLALFYIFSDQIFEYLARNSSNHQTRAKLKGLELAIKGYETEYNRFPGPPLRTERAYIEARAPFLDILTGKYSTYNPRNVVFWEPSPVRNRIGGDREIAPGVIESQDQWGKVIRIHVDWDGDGFIPDPEHSGTVVSGSVIIYSAGRDGDYSTWGDNIKSWGP